MMDKLNQTERQILMAVGLGILSALFGMIQFNIPGVEGAATDFRELFLLFAVIILGKWYFIIIVCLISSFSAVENAYLTTFLMHFVATLAIRPFFKSLYFQSKKAIESFLLSIGIIAIYYYVFLLPSFVVLNHIINESANSIWDDLLIILVHFPFEFLITSIITSLIIVIYKLYQDIKEKNNLLQMVINGGDIGYWVWDLHSDTLFISKQIAELLHLGKADMRVANSLLVIHPDDKMLYRNKVQALKSGKIKFLECNYRLKIHDRQDDYVWLQERSQISRYNSEGFASELSGIMININDHRNMLNQVVHKQKMDSIGMLAGGIAHDFNNILSVINGYSTMLAIDESLNDTQREKVNHILKAGERAGALTKQLLTFSKKDIIQGQIIELNSVIKESMKLIRPLISSDIEILLNLAESDIKIYADASQVEQIIMNLVLNARDAIYMKKNNPLKKITIKSYVLEIKETNYFDYIEIHQGFYAVLELCDTGIGIEKDKQMKIYEPFYTTKEKGKGTGLGLATVYGIVKQNLVHIKLESDLNQGACFQIFWPLEQSAIDHVKSKNQEKVIEFKTLKLLCVEDEENVRKMTAEMLKVLKINCQTAASAEEALEILKNNQFDIIVSDLIMPGMNGNEFRKRVLELKIPSKFILASGYAESTISEQDMDEIRDYFLQKPYTLDQLKNTIIKAVTLK